MTSLIRDTEGKKKGFSTALPFNKPKSGAHCAEIATL